MDYTILGLEELLGSIQRCDAGWRDQSFLLWDCMRDAIRDSGEGFFQVVYKWSYSHERCTATFSPEFVRLLRESPWLPGAGAEPKKPSDLCFAELADEFRQIASPFIVQLLQFKPDEIKQLAEKTGIGEEHLTILRDFIGGRDVTADELRKRLGLKKYARPGDGTEAGVDGGDCGQAIDGPPGDDHDELAPQIPDFSADGAPGDGSGGSGTPSGGGIGDGARTGAGGSRNRRAAGLSGRQTDAGGSNTDDKRGRPFISYVGAHPNDEEPDPDGLDTEARIALEGKAIRLIVERYPELRQAPPNNPGFDLFEADSDDRVVRWVEVKAMTRDLHYRPIALSRCQIECAREHGPDYWLYVVERANGPGAAAACSDPGPHRKDSRFYLRPRLGQRGGGR